MKITTVGIDLAKSVFQVHGVDERGKAVLRKKLKRAEVAEFFANMPACLVGMEACGSAHYWGRKLVELGHTVKLMAPQFVKPYVKTNKNDARDAEAICEAVARPNMRFVPLKLPEQQAVLALHRARQGFVKTRTAQANQMRGLLAEFGLVIPKGIGHVAAKLPDILEDAENGLPASSRQLFARLLAHFKELDRQVGELEQWPAVGGMVGAGATPGLHRRQDHAIGHQQARRCVSAYAVDSRRAVGVAATPAPCRSRRWVASARGSAAQP
jgi:transposase